MPNPVVHIIDDDEPLRRGLANLLRSFSFEVAEHEFPQRFMENWHASTCGCILLDIQFEGGSGLEFQARFQEVGINMPVILMTAFADVESSVRGMKAGAVDFLVKPFDEKELLEVVAVALDRDLVRHRKDNESDEFLKRFSTLTSREKEVLSWVVAGLMNKQIAVALNLSEATIKTYRGIMMRKMEVRTIADLVRAAESFLPVVNRITKS